MAFDKVESLTQEFVYISYTNIACYIIIKPKYFTGKQMSIDSLCFLRQ